jgi:DNA-binding response OmpR family regulator
MGGEPHWSQDFDWRAFVALIVEGEYLAPLCTAAPLRECGLKVIVVSNAADALDVLDRVGVDLLFTEVKLPGDMDGLDLVGWVKVHRPTIKTLVTSAADDSQVRNLPSREFLPNPFRLIDLEILVRAILASRSAEA